MQTISEVRDGFKETEIGLIPEDWKVAKLKDVSDFKNGINFTREQKGNTGILTVDVLNMYDEGLYINLQNLYRVNKKIPDEYLLRDGDILFVRSSLKQEGVGWASLFKGINEPVTFCGFIIRARLKSPNISPDFLAYFLRSSIARKRLVSSSGKVAITNINQGMLGALTIPIPPFIEQQKIAFILSKIQQAIQQQEKIIEATKNLKKSLMHKLFTEGTRGEEQKETEIGLIPRSWDIKNLSDVAKLTSGGTPNRRVSQYFGGTIPWVKSGELEDNTIFDTEEKITEEGLRNSSAKIFPRGTLLIAMYGATVGKTAILGIEAATNQAVCAVFPKNNILTTEFLRYYIIFARHRLLSERFGGAQPNISQTILRNIRIVIPPLTEQQEIACVLTYTDKKIEIEERRKATLQQLFKTMLNKLMTGEIRVKDIDLGVINVS